MCVACVVGKEANLHGMAWMRVGTSGDDDPHWRTCVYHDSPRAHGAAWCEHDALPLSPFGPTSDFRYLRFHGQVFDALTLRRLLEMRGSKRSRALSSFRTFVVLCGLSLKSLAQALPEGHPQVEASSAPAFSTLAAKLESQKEKSFENSVTLGELYESHGLVEKAIGHLTQAADFASPLRQFYAGLRRKWTEGPLPTLPREACTATPSTSVAEWMGVLKSKSGDLKASLACAQWALEPVRKADVLLGRLLFLEGKNPEAQKVYARLADVLDEPFGLYAQAMMLIDSRGEDVASLRQAKALLEVFLKKAPGAPSARQASQMVSWAEKAIAAGGIAQLRPRPVEKNAAMPSAPALAPEVVQAFQKTEQTPEMQANFARILEAAEEHLARGRFQDALNGYKSVMPYQPQNGRVQAGMAWSLIGLNKPMAQRVWTVAVENHAEAIVALSKTLELKGDKAGAAALRTRLEAARAP